MKIQKSILSLTIVMLAIVSLSAKSIPDIKDFVKVSSNLYALRHEVTNKEYQEFLKYLKAHKQNDDFIKCMYDSTQWVKKFTNSFNEPIEKSYHSHHAYDNYPIVNITPDGAKSYCEWLTDRYNNDSKRKYKKVVFRLPDENEWKKLADPLPDNNLPWNGNTNLSDNGKIYFSNIKIKDTKTSKDNYVIDGGLTTIITEHYKPNKLGIFDVIGNVAEMTQDGLIKGGSWDNYLAECTIDKTQKYSLPDPRVGFRIVMEIIEK